jgi:hypothetical protein
MATSASIVQDAWPTAQSTSMFLIWTESLDLGSPGFWPAMTSSSLKAFRMYWANVLFPSGDIGCRRHETLLCEPLKSASSTALWAARMLVTFALDTV